MGIPVLVVDADVGYGKLIQKSLESNGQFQVTLATRAIEALMRFTETRFRVAVVDFDLPDLNGEDLIRQMRGIDEQITIVAVLDEQKVKAAGLDKLSIEVIQDKPSCLKNLPATLSELFKLPSPSSAVNQPAPITPELKAQAVREEDADEKNSAADSVAIEETREKIELEKPVVEEKDSAPQWLQGPNQIQDYFSRLGQEHSAYASLLSQGDTPWSFSETLTENQARGIVRLLSEHNDGMQSKGALIRYIHLSGTGNDYLLYATPIVGDINLTLIFSMETPFSVARRQTLKLSQLLASEDPRKSTPLAETPIVEKLVVVSEEDEEPLSPSEWIPGSKSPVKGPQPAVQSGPSPITEDKHLMEAFQSAPVAQEKLVVESARSKPVTQERHAAEPAQAIPVAQGELVVEPAQSKPVVQERRVPEPEQATPVAQERHVAEPEQATPVAQERRVPEPEQATPVAQERRTAEPAQATPVAQERRVAEPAQSKPFVQEELVVEPAPAMPVVDKKPLAEPIMAPPITSTPEVPPLPSDWMPKEPKPASHLPFLDAITSAPEKPRELESPALPFQEPKYYLPFTAILLPRFPSHTLVGSLANQLETWLNDLCIAWGWRVETIDLRPELLRFTVSLSPEIAPAQAIQNLAQNLSTRILQAFPGLSEDLPSGEFWAKRYLLTAGSDVGKDRLASFIETTRKDQGLSN